MAFEAILVLDAPFKQPRPGFLSEISLLFFLSFESSSVFNFAFVFFEKSLLFCVVMVELVSLHRYSRVYILTATFIYILKLNVYMSSLPWDNTV